MAEWLGILGQDYKSSQQSDSEVAGKHQPFFQIYATMLLYQHETLTIC